MTKIMKGGVAYNSTANMVALTQAEYNALSTAQKNNGNFYFITDADPSYFSAENIDYDNTDSGLTATNVQDAVDEVDNLLPVYIKQTAGTSIQMQVIATFFYYYATQWGCYIPYPFICKNTNYSVSLDEIIAENVGNITSKCTLVSKSPCFCTIRTDNTMSSFPNYWSACVARCKITITFA